jgi:hypothetical protein
MIVVQLCCEGRGDMLPLRRMLGLLQTRAV